MNTPEANRARVAAGYCNEFYDQQKQIERGWHLGSPPPKGLVLGQVVEVSQSFVYNKNALSMFPFYMKLSKNSA